MLKLILGAAAGFAAAWFLDPNEGARRRGQAREQTLKYARRQKEAGPIDAGERLNDPALQAKIESEAFREAGAPTGQVAVNVEAGIAYLRGELPDRSAIDRLVEAVAKVEGVQEVESLLHAPGEPAPAKDETRHDTAGTPSG